MVLFYEEKKPPTRTQIIRRRIIWTVVTIVVLVWLSLTILHRLGGNAEPLKLGLQDYLSRSTGTTVTVGRFDYAGFFPDIRADLGSVRFEKGGNAEPVMTVGDVSFSLSFFRRDHINALSVSGIKIEAGLYTRDALIVDVLKIDPDQSALISSGSYGAQPFNARINMKKHVRKNGIAYYTRAPQAAFSIDFALIKADGTMSHAPGGGLLVDFKSLGFPDALARGAVVVGDGHGKTGLSFSLETQDGADPAAVWNAITALYCRFMLPDAKTVVPVTGRIGALDLSSDDRKLSCGAQEQ